MAALRELLLANSPAELLIVGHTDTTGDPEYNDKLSVRRAESMSAFLRDAVDEWLEFYGESTPPEQRWGAHEDARMLFALSDFPGLELREDPVRWFQRTRLLSVDGIAGPETRRQLITEYMQLDGVALEHDPGLSLRITCHGCGESFPVNEAGTELDPGPPDEREDALDRRVELFLFDPEFGIQPPPPGTVSKPGSTQYPSWRKRAELRKNLSADARRVSIRLLDDADAPQDGAHYRVRIGHELHLGTARAGVVELATATQGSECTVEWNPKNEEPLPLSGGEPSHVQRVFVLEPAAGSDPNAAQQRLHNLGYAPEFGLESALSTFQSDEGLPLTGELDAATEQRLNETYDKLLAGEG